LKKHWILLWGMMAAQVWAQETPVVTVVATPIAKWSVSTVPWDDWFKNNALVTDKTDHVHFFWNAQDFKGNFEVKDKKFRLGEAALELVKRLYPADAKADLVKVDIVYVLERDSYGMPKWDSLQQVAHLEFLKSKALKAGKKKFGPTAAAMKKIFDKFELY
jgi:hypothetical protein